LEDSGAGRALQCRRSNPNDLAQKRHTQSHKEQESRITQSKKKIKGRKEKEARKES
jgi:hypothetical protein